MPEATPRRARAGGNGALPWRKRRGVPSSSPTSKTLRAGGGGGAGRGDGGVARGSAGRGAGDRGASGSAAGGRSVKNVSTASVMSRGTSARGSGTRDGSGVSLRLAMAGGGGGSGGGASGGGGGGGGISGSRISISRIIRSGGTTCATISLDSASTQMSVAAAVSPTMSERKDMVGGRHASADDAAWQRATCGRKSAG